MKEGARRGKEGGRGLPPLRPAERSGKCACLAEFPLSLPSGLDKKEEGVSGQKVSARRGLFFVATMSLFLLYLRTVVQLFSYREGTPDKNATRQKNTKRTGNKRGNNDFPLFCANICVGERGGVGWLVPFHDCCCAGISFTENAARPPTPPPPIKNGKKACCRAAN